MAISYPLALPTTTGIAKIRLSANSVVGISMSPFTAKQQVYKYTGQYWEAEITLPPMKRSEAEYWISFLLKLNGSYGTFLLGDPNGATARGVATGTPLVNGASQTGNELVTDGWTTSTTGILKAGDYIQLGTGSSAKLHKVLDDVDSDSSGNATITIWPDLRSAPSDNAAIVVSGAKGVFRLSTNQSDWDVNEASIYGMTFPAREAL
ncbi:MAG: hypothetical protein ACO222_07310 [Polynucleobacter sp.]